MYTRTFFKQCWGFGCEQHLRDPNHFEGIAAGSARRVLFTRDPLNRFVSGALEIIVRGYCFRGKDDGLYAVLGGLTMDGNASTCIEGDGISGGSRFSGTIDPSLNLQEFVERFLNGSLVHGSFHHLSPQIEAIAQERRRSQYSQAEPTATSEISPLDGRYYIGSIETMSAELDALFGTASDVHARGRSNSTSRYVFSEGLTRTLCRVYWRDVCCLDVRFRTQCEAVNVTCDVPPSLPATAPPPPPPRRAAGTPLYDWLKFPGGLELRQFMDMANPNGGSG